MKKTYKEIIVFYGAATAFIEKNKSETKLVHSLKKVLKKVSEKIGEYNEKLSDLRLDFCATDPVNHVVLKDAHGNLMFTVEKTRQLNTSVKKLLESEVHIERHILLENEELKSKLTEEEIELFTGYVFNEPAKD